MKYSVIPEPINFDWDRFNLNKIHLKHGIALEEAEQAFLADYILQFDEQHSTSEKRYQLLGACNSGKVLFIVFTVRGDRIRIISARSASKKERTFYAKKT